MNTISQMPVQFFQLLAIFLSLIIEALPFVFIGTILSGFIETFVTPNWIQWLLPQQKIARIFFGTVIGLVFPSCECGIVPIVSRFLEKKVPSYTAIPFMITAPVINPVVLFATYSAFGNSWYVTLLRLFGASLVAITLGLLLGFVLDNRVVKNGSMLSQWNDNHPADHDSLRLGQKIFNSLQHAIDDFFDVSRYLVFGALFASSMQIFVPTRWLNAISHTPLLAIVLLMGLAFILSLCSEADAFIGASLMSNLGLAPVMAFLLFGPIVDLKNLLLMMRVFKGRFISQFIGVSALVIVAYCLILEVIS